MFVAFEEIGDDMPDMIYNDTRFDFDEYFRQSSCK